MVYNFLVKFFFFIYYNLYLGFVEYNEELRRVVGVDLLLLKIMYMGL